MSNFNFRLDGRKFVGDRVALPASVYLLVIIALAIGVTMLFTGTMSQQEAELELMKEKLEAKTRARTNSSLPDRAGAAAESKATTESIGDQAD